MSNHLQVRIDTHVKYEEKRVNLDDLVFERLQLENDEKILDVGCATGSFLILLQSNGHKGQLTGLDQSTKMINEAKNKSNQKGLNIEWVVGDARNLLFPGIYYDWVVARHMLYHVPDVKKQLKDLKQ